MDYTDHLLPSNARPLEQALSWAMDAQTGLVLPAEAIRSFKTDPADSLLPWLIWEYGLGELLPWLSEPRRAIAEGILWQRLRGTPEALRIALSWIGAEDVFVEEEVPGMHFSEFQIDPGFVPVGDALINDLIAIAQLSAPARSRLARIYHGYDLRRFILDESLLGEALLSDYSGVLHSDGKTRLSFGREFFLEGLGDGLPDHVISALEIYRFAWARIPDRYLLDFARLGDPGHTRNEEIIHSRLFSLVNDLALPKFVPLLPERKFCRAEVVLSDSTPLGDTNANLPRFCWKESGTQMRPGFGALSESDHRLTRVEVLERFDAEHHGLALVPQLLAWSFRHGFRTFRVPAFANPLGQLRTGECGNARPIDGVLQRLHTRSQLRRPPRIIETLHWPCAQMPVQLLERDGDALYWWYETGSPIVLGESPVSDTPHHLERLSCEPVVEQHVLPDEIDATLGEAQFLPERRFCKAQVVLSESVLGQTNANLPKAIWLQEGAPEQLGGIRLGESEYRLRPTEVLERIEADHAQALAAPAPTLRAAIHGPEHGHQARLPHFARLGEWRMGELRPVRDGFHHWRVYSLIIQPLPDPAPLVPRLFQKAQVVLSEVVLGETNTRTPRRALHRRLPIPRLGRMVLGERAEIEWLPLTEMFDQQRQGGTAETFAFELEHMGAERGHVRRVHAQRLDCASGQFALGHCSPGKPAVSPFLGRRQHSGAAAWQGQTWTQVRWPDASWAQVRELIGSTHTTTTD